MTFRLLAPQAEDVSLRGTDIPGNMRGTAMTKGDEGVWSATVGPLDAGAYRYNFNVGGVSVIDPRNPSTSESNNNTWSLVVVPGSDEFDTKQVPHGAVASVTYYSTALGRFRRMHVYTPPGYEIGQQKFPVFYLLHGAGDSDDSWTSVGRAGFILDNLIAAKRAKPMIVVMPAGHTSRTGGGRGAPGARDEFNDDFTTDVMPYVEKNYRVLTGSCAPRNRRPFDGRRTDADARSSVTRTRSRTSASSARASSGSSRPPAAPAPPRRRLHRRDRAGKSSIWPPSTTRRSRKA